MLASIFISSFAFLGYSSAGPVSCSSSNTIKIRDLPPPLDVNITIDYPVDSYASLYNESWAVMPRDTGNAWVHKSRWDIARASFSPHYASPIEARGVYEEDAGYSTKPECPPTVIPVPEKMCVQMSIGK
jgi:hypothetical protein